MPAVYLPPSGELDRKRVSLPVLATTLAELCLLLLRALAGLAFTLLCGGCGTFGNLVPIDSPREPTIYGGVQGDCELAKQVFALDFEKIQQGHLLDCCSLVGPTTLFAIDLPLSAVGDTLTIPLVLQGRERATATMTKNPEAATQPPTEVSPDR